MTGNATANGPKEKTADSAVAVLLAFHGDRIDSYCKERIAAGIAPHAIFDELSLGLEEIGRGFEDPVMRRYFNADLIISGRNMRRAIERLAPLIPRVTGHEGLVLIGTVQGDVHDIGKQIVAVTLEANGFFVRDLGTDVAAEVFASAVATQKPDILALSALLTTTAPAMADVVRLLVDQGLRQEVRILVGGRAVDAAFANRIGADAYAPDSITALRICRRWMEAKTEGKGSD